MRCHIGRQQAFKPAGRHHQQVCRRAVAAAASRARAGDDVKAADMGSALGEAVAQVHRRQLMQVAAAFTVAAQAPAASAAPTASPAFVTTPSGLKVQDVRVGEGAAPQPGDVVSVHWSGYTKGYQGKRIDNTSLRDEPYEFVLGSGQAIAGFDEAVASMRVGGIRRVEIPGAHPELGYSLDRTQRFTDELISPDLKIFKYRQGPQPAELGGQRALDFVLDNDTLRDFNRDLLMDIKLLAVYKRGGRLQ